MNKNVKEKKLKIEEKSKKNMATLKCGLEVTKGY